MKRRDISSDETNAETLNDLCAAVNALRDVSEVRAFLRDLCTPAELEAMADRWRVVAPLQAGIAYRTIHDQSGVSATTIGRVARTLSMGEGGYKLALQRLQASATDRHPRASRHRN